MKTRPDNLLANLPEEHHDQLHDWIDAGHSHAKIVELLAEHCQIHTHKTSVDRYCRRLEEQERSQDASLSIESLQTAIPEAFDQAAVAGLKHKLYKLAADPKADTLEFARLFRLRLRLRDQELSREKFEHNAAKAIVKNFDKIAKLMRNRDPREERAILDRIRLEVFGTLTDAEEPLTEDPPTAAPEPVPAETAEPPVLSPEPATETEPAIGEAVIIGLPAWRKPPPPIVEPVVPLEYEVRSVELIDPSDATAPPGTIGRDHEIPIGPNYPIRYHHFLPYKATHYQQEAELCFELIGEAALHRLRNL